MEMDNEKKKKLFTLLEQKNETNVAIRNLYVHVNESNAYNQNEILKRK